MSEDRAAVERSVVRGRLDEIQHGEIQHGASRFRLVVEDGSQLWGTLIPSLSAEVLRNLWGGDVVVEGVLRRGAGGGAQSIEAHRIESVSGRCAWEESPERAREKISAFLSSGFVGCAEGPADLSERYKDYLTEGLERKHGSGGGE